MRSTGPHGEISSAKTSATMAMASARLPSNKSAWIFSASAAKPMRPMSSLWKLRFFEPMPPI